MLIKPYAVAVRAAIDFGGVVHKQLVLGHGYATTYAQAFAGTKCGAQVELVVVLVYALVLLGNGLVQRSVFKPQTMAVAAVENGWITGGLQAFNGAGRAVFRTFSKHEILFPV